MRLALHVSTLLVVLALLGCAGPGTVPVDTGSAGVADSSSADTASAMAAAVSGDVSESAMANDAWREWLANPGVPGLDYDPRRIVVVYNADAVMPAEMGSLAPPMGERSSDQPNSLLRQNARFELGKAARFGQIVVGAQREPLDDISLVCTRGEHDDRRIGHLAQALAGRPTVHLVHHDVQDDRVWAMLVSFAYAFLAVFCRDHAKAFAFQTQLHERPQACIVVDKEYGFVHAVPLIVLAIGKKRVIPTL